MGSYNFYSVFGCFNRKFEISEKEPPPDDKSKISEKEPPQDVKGAFSTYAENGPHMRADQFVKFLVDYQGEKGCTLADAERIMHEVDQRRHHLTRHSRPALTLDDFFYFLFQDDLNGPINTQVHHDMNAPLQHYFIYTGHNSYLSGNQLSSDCSEIPIINALKRGVRGIELDLWPNSTEDNIHVLSGRTLATPVPLIKCLKSIKDHAFSKSSYPVIITLEDHLPRHLQAKVPEMVTQTLGDMLFFSESKYLEEFPSPEALKHRIILSTKPPMEYLESKKDEETAPLLENDSSEVDLSVKGSPDRTAEAGVNEKTENDVADGDGEDSEINSQNSVQPAAPVIYKRLIAVHAGKAKHGLKHALVTGIGKVSCLSLREQELRKAAESYGTHLVRLSQKKILRVYMNRTRVISSNFKPVTGWMHGAQMVAFNMQEYGESLWLMHGMFRSNGSCGYVKKPDFLMKRGLDNAVFDPKVALRVKKTLKVNVYLGDGWRLDFSHRHVDAYSPPDFYTKLYIVGAPADAAKKKTRTIEGDWIPNWDQDFTFPLTVPELALLRIVVREYDMSEKDDFGGQTCLPVEELKPGIRAVPLYDEKGEKLRSVRLLMRFQFV